jgi:hypothetical protein
MVRKIFPDEKFQADVPWRQTSCHRFRMVQLVTRQSLTSVYRGIAVCMLSGRVNRSPDRFRRVDASSWPNLKVYPFHGGNCGEEICGLNL